MEMLAKACSTGASHIYVSSGDGMLLEELALSEMKSLSFNVFDGQFTRETDKEMLVIPTLGLYSRLLRLPRHEVENVLSTIFADRDNFFPIDYIDMRVDRPDQKRILFGTVIKTLHRHLRLTGVESFQLGQDSSCADISLDGGRIWPLNTHNPSGVSADDFVREVSF